MRFRTFLALAALASAATLTGCGNNDDPLTDAQLQRKLQEQQLQANQAQLDAQRQQQRLDLEAQRLQNQAMQQQLLPPAQPQYQQAPAAPAQHTDSGIGAGTAILGAAAVGTAGYMLGKSASNTSNNTYNARYQQPATRVVSQPAPKPVYSAPKSSYVAPKSTTRPSAGYTRMSSTKRR